MNKRVRVVVHGRVHGVGFRAYTQATAAGMGLTGYVRNRDDGTVEIEAEGAASQIDRLVAWCRTGPSMARVDTLEVEESAPTGEWQEFSVRY
jgi:acylphosphatase